MVPLAVALFTFILIANWLELIPSGDDPHLLPPPTADVNLTYALGLLVIVGVHVFSIRRRRASRATSSTTSSPTRRCSRST